MSTQTELEVQYKVVVNHEEQYSIWFLERPNALGWNDVGKTGTKEECLAYIKEIWTDMRPLSLRRQMDEQKASNEQRITEKADGLSKRKRKQKA